MRKLTKTIVAPVGKFNPKEIKIPPRTERTPMKEAIRRDALKPFETCNEDTAGKIRSAEVNKIPTAFMVKTTVTAVKRKRIVLIFLVLIPAVFADSSSNVVDKRS